VTVFPLKVSPNSRYLVDQNGTPVPIFGDAAWEAIQNLTITEVRTYLDDRVAKGFNAVIMELIEHCFTPHTPRWANKAGDLPFDSSNHFDQPNEAYWSYVDSVISEAESRGMVVFASIAYPGFPGDPRGGQEQGWYTEMSAQSTKLRGYGRYVATRLINRKNIIWLIGGDWDEGSYDINIVARKIVSGIVAAEADNKSIARLLIGHVHSEPDPAAYLLGEMWAHINFVYANGVAIYQRARTAWGKTHVAPFLCIEAYYENENSTNGQILRRQCWWIWTQGGCGYVFGNDPMWFFGVQGDGNPGYTFAISSSHTWSSDLSTNGALYMQYAWSLLSARAWYNIVPDDATHSFLISGYGTDGNTSYATGGVTADGSLGLVYVPAVLNVVVNMSKMRGATTARWYDPTNGTFTTISGSPFSNAGNRTFSHPGNNNAGDGDWVLVLEA